MYALRWLWAALSSRRCTTCQVCTGLEPTCTSCTSGRAHLHCGVCDHGARYHDEGPL